MTKRVAAAAGLSAILAASTVSLGAFGDAGHRIIGTLAEMHLRDSRALAEVRKILAAKETLADASVWPDVIKSAVYEDTDTALFRLEHPAHDTYHYANLPFQADRYGDEVPGARAMDIVQTLRESIRVLRGESKRFRPREALRVLAHLVGDVHQPLHVGNAFVSSDRLHRFVEPAGATGWRPTLGGNALVYGPEDRFNLHSYWDAHAVNITRGSSDPAAYAARLFGEIPVAPAWRAHGNADAWPEQWAAEALVLAKRVHEGITITAYIGPDDAKRTAHRWRITQPPGYDDLARRVIPTQLAAGGYRLAAVLQSIWPDRP